MRDYCTTYLLHNAIYNTDYWYSGQRMKYSHYNEGPSLKGLCFRRPV